MRAVQSNRSDSSRTSREHDGSSVNEKSSHSEIDKSVRAIHTPKLRLENVTKSYGAVSALRPTSLDVPAGEFLTILGPSGSGKTTLLQMLAGLVTVDEGDIWLDGKRATHSPPHERGIGMVFQNYALFPHLTVAQNISFPLEMRGFTQSEIQERVRKILEVVKLSHAADRLPQQLSGGQQQRIAFARCAVYQPPIILMDEPLGALDKRLRDQMQTEIRRIHKELKATILYVTHDQEEAMSMSDRICLMNDGRIEQIGTPLDIYFRPQTIFAAEFVGTANVLGGTIHSISHDTMTIRHSGQATIRARLRSGNHWSVGDRVATITRPENVRVLTQDETAENELSVVIEDAMMIGPFTKIHMQTSDNVAVSALTVSIDKEGAFRQGDRVRIGWDINNTVALADRSKQ